MCGFFLIDGFLIFKLCGFFLIFCWVCGWIELIVVVGVFLRFDLFGVCCCCIIMFFLMWWKSCVRFLFFMWNVFVWFCIVVNFLKLFVFFFFEFFSNFVVINYGFFWVFFLCFFWYIFVFCVWNFCGGIFVWDINIGLVEMWGNIYFLFVWFCFVLWIFLFSMKIRGL